MGVFHSILSVVDRRLRRPVSERSHRLVISGVRLLLGCYLHFCSHRFVAHRRVGRSIMGGFVSLLSRCVTQGTRHRKLPAMTCFTSGYYCSAGCFNRLIGARANEATGDLVGSQLLSTTHRLLISRALDVARIDRRLNFRCPRRFIHFFGTRANGAPDRCHGATWVYGCGRTSGIIAFV